MATLKHATGAQYELAADFTFDISASDQMVAVDTILSDFTTNGKAFDIIPMPYGAEVIGGELNVLTVSNAATTHTVSVGDSASATRYLGATNIKAAGYTALVPTGYQSLGEPIRITIAETGAAATAGKVKVGVRFTVASRQNENLKIV